MSDPGDNLILIDGEAWTADEFERYQRRLRQQRDAKRRKRALNLPPQASKPIRVGALHELSCKGPHEPNLRCRPIPMYQRVFRKEPA